MKKGGTAERTASCFAKPIKTVCAYKSPSSAALMEAKRYSVVLDLHFILNFLPLPELLMTQRRRLSDADGTLWRTAAKSDV